MAPDREVGPPPPTIIERVLIVIGVMGVCYGGVMLVAGLWR